MRPFTSDRYKKTLTGQEMWSLVHNSSVWGVFAGDLGSATVRELDRDGDEGGNKKYYLYEVTARLEPEKTGPIEIGDLAVLVRYPERLRRRRDLFGGQQFQIEASTLVAARVDERTIDVRTPPEEGRPPP